MEYALEGTVVNTDIKTNVFAKEVHLPAEHHRAEPVVMYKCSETAR